MIDWLITLQCGGRRVGSQETLLFSVPIPVNWSTESRNRSSGCCWLANVRSCLKCAVKGTRSSGILSKGSAKLYDIWILKQIGLNLVSKNNTEKSWSSACRTRTRRVPYHRTISTVRLALGRFLIIVVETIAIRILWKFQVFTYNGSKDTALWQTDRRWRLSNRVPVVTLWVRNPKNVFLIIKTSYDIDYI